MTVLMIMADDGGHDDDGSDDVDDDGLDGAVNLTGVSVGEAQSFSCGMGACSIRVHPSRRHQVTTHAQVDYEAVARQAARDAGYNGTPSGFCADTAEVKVLIDQQSPEIGKVRQGS